MPLSAYRRRHGGRAAATIPWGIRGRYSAQRMPVMVWLLAALLFPTLASCKRQEPGIVQLRIVDEAGESTPAFVAARPADGSEWISLPQPFLANAQEDKRSRRPQWRGRQPIHCNGSVELRLAAGRYLIVAGKGVEFAPASRQVDVTPRETTTLELKLERWENMPARGWWSGDTHVHITRDRRDLNQPILWMTQAEDIHVANLLEMGDIEIVVWPQYAWGEEGIAQQGDYWLVVGQEEPRTHQIGHAVMLDIPHLLRDTQNYYLYDRIFRRARELGGLAGIAHFVNGKFHSERSADVLFPQGLVDFVEILDNNNKLRPLSFYDALNLGFRPTAVAGSDYPWGSHPGDQRVYVYVDPTRPFSPRRWFEGLRRGRTFVTQGPLLDLEVNGSAIGSTLKVERGARLRIHARAWGHPDIGAPRKLALVAMGQDLKTVTSSEPSQDSLDLTEEIEARNSLWLASSAEAHNGAVAHTSALFIEVDGKPIRAEGAALEWAIERALERLGSLRQQELVPPGAQRDALTRQVDDASDYYRRLRQGEPTHEAK